MHNILVPIAGSLPVIRFIGFSSLTGGNNGDHLERNKFHKLLHFPLCKRRSIRLFAPAAIPQPFTAPFWPELTWRVNYRKEDSRFGFPPPLYPLILPLRPVLIMSLTNGASLLFFGFKMSNDVVRFASKPTSLVVRDEPDEMSATFRDS